MLFGEGLVEFKITFTTRCSGNCNTCLNPQIKNHYVLDNTLFKSIVQQIIELDIPNEKLVSFYSIGESYLHQDYVEMCEWAIPLLHNKNIRTMIVTNGTHVKSVPRGIDTFVISFNAGRKETYEKITGINYDLVYKNINNLYSSGELKKANDVQIHMLCFDENDGEENDFLKQFRCLKGVKYRFRYGYDNQYESTDNKGRPEQYSQKITRVPCVYVTNIVTIYPNGDVVRCCHDFFDKYSYGNLNDRSLFAILTSEGRKKVYDDHYNGRYMGICEKCDLNRSSLKDEMVYGFFDERDDELFAIQKKNIGDYYSQLVVSSELFERIKDKKVFLWGLGKRGQAFERVCREKGISIDFRYDKDRKFDMDLKQCLLDSEVIIASNFNIYSMVMYSYQDVLDKAINLERYCPA